MSVPIAAGAAPLVDKHRLFLLQAGLYLRVCLSAPSKYGISDSWPQSASSNSTPMKTVSLLESWSDLVADRDQALTLSTRASGALVICRFLFSLDPLGRPICHLAARTRRNIQANAAPPRIM